MDKVHHRSVGIPDIVAGEGFIEKVTFEWRLKANEGTNNSHAAYLKK